MPSFFTSSIGTVDSSPTLVLLLLCLSLTAMPMLGHSLFYSKTVFWSSYCQISTDLEKILHTPVVVRNTLVIRLRPRSARGRLQAKPKRQCPHQAIVNAWPSWIIDARRQYFFIVIIVIYIIVVTTIIFYRYGLDYYDSCYYYGTRWLKWSCEAGGAHLSKPGWSKTHTHFTPN